MARVAINTGASANDGTGDNLRSAGGILNNNFLELYTYLGAGSTTVLSAPLWSSTNAGINTLRNVGIGTTNPTSALTVSGDGTFTGVVTATTFIGALTGTASTATLATNAQGLTGTPNITVGVVTASRLNVGTSGTIITTTASGLVGIGTTNPRFALEVGAVGASGTTLFVNGDARVTGIVTIGPASITLNGITNIINVGTGITINGSTGIISATSIVLGGTTLTGAGVTFITAGSGISVDQGTGNVTITATGGGGSSQFVTTAAGIHTLSNVGIGTTNPTSALTVTGNGTFTGVVTATTFVGELTGTATTSTNAQGLTGTPNITVGVVTATTFNSNADVTIYGIRVGRGEGANAFNTVVGNEALNSSNSGANNTAYGYRSLYSNTTGYQNTANGGNALRDNNTGANNTASGVSALLYNTTGNNNTANGALSLAYNITGSQNTATGHNALNSATGSNNTGIGVSAGQSITTGSRNTILGSYTGNQNGLDIRTSDGNVVLSDGDGNIRFYANSSGNVGLGTTNPTSALTVTGNGTFTGVVTATTFIGALTGTATNATNAQGLTGTPNITVGVVTANRFILPDCGNIINTDNTEKLTFGTTPDFKIYHLNQSGIGTQNRIEVKTHPLHIGTIEPLSNSVYHNSLISVIPGTNDARVELGFGGTNTTYVLQTTGYGVSISGGIIASGIITTSTLNVGTGGTIITTTTSGLVGIGTTNPLNALAIQKNPTVNGAAIVSISPVSLDSGYSSLLGFIASQNGSMNIGIAGTLPYGNGNITGLDEYSGYIDCYGAPFSIATNSIVRLKINDNGNIGIGTTNPTEKLTVIGVTSSTSFYGDASYTASGRWTLGANGSADYTFTGIGFTQTTNDPVLYLARGRVYEFVNNSGGSHPFQIRVSDGGSAYSNGVTNNGGASGVIRFEIPFNAPNTLYYQCTSHSGMGNTISVYPNTI